MIRREQLRLKTTFKKLLLLSLAAPAAVVGYACSASSSGNDAVSPPDGGVDATTGDDQSAPPTDAGISDASDANDGAPMCVPGVGYYNDASWIDDAGPDGSSAICQYFVDFNCDPGFMTAPPPTACNLYLRDCSNICTLDGGGFFDCLYFQDAGCNDGSVDSVPGQPITIACGLCTGVGRRPAGLRRARRDGSPSPLGGYFAEAAHPRGGLRLRIRAPCRDEFSSVPTARRTSW